jgi:hypothetical protein
MNEAKWVALEEKIYENLLKVNDPKIFQTWVESLQTLETAKGIAARKE